MRALLFCILALLLIGGASAAYTNYSWYPPAFSGTYVVSNSTFSGSAYATANPATSLTGAAAWLGGNSETNMLHIDIGTARIITDVYYENHHNSGTETTRGVKNFTIWGSNSASAFSTMVIENTTDWTQLTPSVVSMDQHVASNVADPKYFSVTNGVAYRYYSIKFSSSWGGGYTTLRRIELQGPHYIPDATMNGLLHFNGTFTDETGPIWTGAGSASHPPYINTTGLKYGNGSMWFYGATDASQLYVTSSLRNQWNDNHTIEFWYYPINSGTTQQLYYQPNGSYAALSLIYDGTNRQIKTYASSAGASYNLSNGNTTTSGGIPLNQWSHIEVDYAYPTFKIFVNGVENQSQTFTSRIAKYNGNTGLGLTTGNNIYGGMDEWVEWNITRHLTAFTPPTSEYLTDSGGGASEFPISANFTQSVNPSSTGQAVTFTDTSNGTVVTRNWTFFYSGGSFNDRNTSPTYTWSTSGTYNVWLNVTNTTGASSSMSQTHTVTNISTIYPQDIWMEGVFAQTFFVHNSDGVGIGNVSINAGNYSTVTSSTGYGTLSTPFGSYLTTFTATGYTTRQISYVFDSDATHDVELTGVVVPVTPSQSTWWTPHQVQVVILDTFGQPLDMVKVTAAYNQSSMPESWLNDLYGLNSNISTQMVNRSLYLHGDTGSDGEVTFPMLGTIKYDIWVTSLPDGVDNYHVQAYPSDDYLNIYVPTTGSQLPTQGNSTYMFLNQSRVYFTEPDINNISMCVDYRDTSGSTTSLTVNWTFANNHTVVNTTTFSPGTSLNTLCYTLRNVRGTQVWWGYNASRAVA